MITATRQWFRRNRTNFAVGAGLLGAGYLAGQYLLSKLTEARQRMSDDRIARENLRRRFEQNQEDCTFTVLAILPTAFENIFEALPVEQTLSELQRQKAERLQRSVAPSDIASTDAPSEAPSANDDDSRSLKSFQSESIVHASQVVDGNNGDGSSQTPLRPKKSKAQLWNDMKINSIARAFTLLYTLSLLTLLTRIQLNLLGRRNYLASVVSLASPPTHGSRISLENHDDDNLEQSYGNDFETNRKYLSFSWWLLHRGCKDIMERVLEAVKEVFGPLNPREEISLERLSELTLEVRKKIEGGTEEERRASKWLPFLLPPSEQENLVLTESGMTPDTDPDTSNTNTNNVTPLRRLLDETSDIIDSPSFSHVLTLTLDATFSVLIDNKIATLSYHLPPVSASTARIVELTDPQSAKTKVANTLAVFCRQAHAIGSGADNEYLAAMENVRDLEAFAAVVYSSNFEFEPPEDASKGSGGAETRPTTGQTSAEDEAASLLLGGDVSIVEREEGGGGEFEAAWGKALAREDGKDS
ncbi:Peroxin-3 [Phyllosticta citricarpa]|uniref:Peroxin-3 n=2 Tax=Phyllosticta TaxID=121621 RepID=A0ABR1LV55_9PEZI